MTGNTNSNDIESMFAGIPFPMMIFLGLLVAWTIEAIGTWQMTQTDSIVHYCSCFLLVGVFRTIPCLAAFIKLLIFRHFSINFMVWFHADFARRLITHSFCSISVKVGQWFNLFTLRTGFRYDDIRHAFLRYRKICLEPILGHNPKLAFFILLAIVLPSTNLYAVSEIRMFSPGITAAYYTMRNVSGQIWYPTGQVWEAYGTGGRTAADYDLALTNKTAGMWVGNFDTNIASGSYYAASYYQAGGSPADADPIVWSEFGAWTGSVWSTESTTAPAIADAVWDELMSDHTTELSFGGEVQQLDPNITTILSHVTAIKAVTDIMELKNTTVSAADDSNSFTITAGLAVADAYRGLTIYVKDATDGNWDAQMIAEYTAGRVVTVDAPMAFTPDVGDIVVIWGLTAYPVDVFDGLPMPPEPETTIVDLRAGTAGGGTRVLNEESEDP